MLLWLPLMLFLATLGQRRAVCDAVNVLFESNGQSLKLGEIKFGETSQGVRVQHLTNLCNSKNVGLLRMMKLHLEFCNGNSWVRLSEESVTQNPSKIVGKTCNVIKKQGQSKGDGLYWLDPNGGSQSNAFQAYCDMTSYNGGWTMCYTTSDKVRPKTEVTYNAKFPYGGDGYRTNCNNIPFTEIIFIDHSTGKKAYFKRRANLPLTASGSYGKSASAFGLWNGAGAASTAYHYQLLICNELQYSGFFVAGYTRCYKRCTAWCHDYSTPYFRTASHSHTRYRGVAFNTNGHRPLSNRRISVGLR